MSGVRIRILMRRRLSSKDTIARLLVGFAASFRSGHVVKLVEIVFVRDDEVFTGAGFVKDGVPFGHTTFFLLDLVAVSTGRY